ncbi:MAG: GrpB family protein [Pseudomonadota bacterium]
MSDVFRITDIDPAALDTARTQVQQKLASVIPADQFHEVGSTAVAGVIGKQDLDFLVLVPEADFLRTRAVLDQMFQRNAEQLSNAVYQGYIVSSEPDVAVQLTVKGGPNDTFLEFVELLRDNDHLITRYNKLKEMFDGQPMGTYRAAKRAFIEQALTDNRTR